MGTKRAGGQVRLGTYATREPAEPEALPLRVAWVARCPTCSERLASLQLLAGLLPWTADMPDPFVACPCGEASRFDDPAVWRTDEPL
jgi:hypothetical protein